MHVALRLYRHEDGPGVKALIRRVWAEYFGTHPDPAVREYMSQPETLADIDSNIYSHPAGAFLVAEASARLVGCGTMHGVSAELCEVKRMYVLPEGRRQGVARRVLGELLVLASTLGYHKARLTSNRALTASHRLYESAGFTLASPWDPDAERYVYFDERDLLPAQGG